MSNDKKNMGQEKVYKQHLLMLDLKQIYKRLIFICMVIFIIVFLVLQEGFCMNINYIFEKYSFKKISNFIESRGIDSTATELRDGRIIFIGGINKNYLSSSEIYDLKYNKFIKTANLNIPRARHSAIILNDGNVLVTGGDTEIDGKHEILKSAEIYNVKNNKFIEISDMNNEMWYHKMFLLENGNVLIVSNPNKLEIYDPKKSEFKKIEGSSIVSDNEIYNFLQLSQNTILMYPKYYKLQETPLFIMNLNDLSFTELKINLFDRKVSSYSIAKISDDKILVTGGDYNQLDSKIIDLNKMIVTQTSNLSQKRYRHISIILDRNNILLLGGESGVGPELKSLKTTDLYNIKEAKFIKFKNMNYNRGFCNYLKLSNGNYIIYGGYSFLYGNQPPEMLILK